MYLIIYKRPKCINSILEPFLSVRLISIDYNNLVIYSKGIDIVDISIAI